MSEQLIYDLESTSESQRVEYVKALCHKLGIPDNLGLISLVHLDEGDGPARLVAYVKRGGAEAIRSNLGVTVTSLTNQMIGGSIVFTATGVDKNGRQEVAIGSKFVEGLTGTQLDDGIMTSSTRALRRLAIQFTGTGILDESEVSERKTIYTQSAPQFVPLQPTVQISSGPGKDVTPLPELTEEERQEEFEKQQAKIRADAIAQLNAKAKAESGPVEDTAVKEVVKKPRKPRGPNKAKVDLGPSVPPQPDIKPDIPAPTPAPIPAPTPVTEQPKPDIPAAPPAQAQPKLTKQQLQPFRQRNFAMMEILEKEGKFLQSEGRGRSDKMRMLAQLMFPEIDNMNQLDEVQWERFLSTIENKIKTDGPIAAVQYIEESINL